MMGQEQLEIGRSVDSLGLIDLLSGLVSYGVNKRKTLSSLVKRSHSMHRTQCSQRVSHACLLAYS